MQKECHVAVKIIYIFIYKMADRSRGRPEGILFNSYYTEKENSEFKPVKLRLKIDLVPYPARAEGLVNMVNRVREGTTPFPYIYIYIYMCVCVCVCVCN